LGSQLSQSQSLSISFTAGQIFIADPSSKDVGIVSIYIHKIAGKVAAIVLIFFQLRTILFVRRRRGKHNKCCATFCINNKDMDRTMPPLMSVLTVVKCIVHFAKNNFASAGFSVVHSVFSSATQGHSTECFLNERVSVHCCSYIFIRSVPQCTMYTCVFEWACNHKSKACLIMLTICKYRGFWTDGKNNCISACGPHFIFIFKYILRLGIWQFVLDFEFSG